MYFAHVPERRVRRFVSGTSGARRVLVLAALALGAGATSRAAEPASGPPAPPAGRTIVAPLSGEVELGVSAFLLRVLREAAPDDLVILDIDTFGGRIDAAVQIRDALLASRAKTAAYVDRRAISAGALIALATDTIVMSHGATMGAATPVQLEGGKMQPVEAKVVSYFRKEMKATAEAKGRRGDIAEAMVDASVVIPGLDGKDTTLTLTTDEAIKYGIAAFEAASLAELCERLHRSPPSVIHEGPNWAERVSRFLAGSAVSSLLMTFGMLGIMIELWAPGHMVAGIVGLVCLLLFTLGHYIVNLAGWETLLLFGAGAGLIALELIFFPGHGVMVVIGVALVVLGLTESMVDVKHVPLGISWSLGWLPGALTRGFGSLLVAIASLAVVARFLPSSRLGRVLILKDSVGVAAAAPPSLLGHAGVAETALRPTGKAVFDGRRVDVVSDGDFIEQGSPLEVIEVAGARVVVKRKRNEGES
jgi:membrane-bound serine protease (ClpP class)